MQSFCLCDRDSWETGGGPKLSKSVSTLKQSGVRWGSLEGSQLLTCTGGVARRCRQGQRECWLLLCRGGTLCSNRPLSPFCLSSAQGSRACWYWGRWPFLCLLPACCEFLYHVCLSGEKEPHPPGPGFTASHLGQGLAGAKWDGPDRRGPAGLIPSRGDTPEPEVLNLMKARTFQSSGGS